MAKGWVYANDSTGWREIADSDLPASGVTASTYGDSTHVGQFTVNAEGVVTAASSVAISGVGSSLEVTDGSTTVAGVTEIDFTSGATVSSGGAGIADVAISGGGGGVSSLDGITGAVTLTAGANITITDNSPSAGDITIAAVGGAAGTVQTPLPFDVPDSSGNAYAGLVQGANLRTLRPAYTNGVDGFWYGVLDVPEDYSSTGKIVLWVAANDTTGHVSRWIVGSNPDTTSATWDAAYTAETAQNLTMSTTAYRPALVSFTLSTTPVAGNSLAFYVERNGSSGSDTLTVPTFLFKAVFQYTAL